MRRPSLIASDVDGTLLDPMARLTDRTAGVISRVAATGVPFVLVTGRPPRWITPVVQSAGLDGYAVCSNGAVLYDIGTSRVVDSHGLDPMLLHDVTHALERALPGMRVAAERASPARDVPVFVTELGYRNPWGDEDGAAAVPRAEVLGHPATKLLVRHDRMSSEEMAAAAIEVLDHAVDVTFSTNHGLIEFSAQGVTKAFGLARVCELFDVPAQDVIAFGDMANDVEMLRWAGHGVAMANAHPRALDAADEVAAPNSEDGVAQVLERWF
ncbi:MAG TPA: Cof-type HAD-IIB family hydrolase [Actinophytocola sp.]|uniref:Cof-type HAD-IIB family hydrolase n=1 Tax=Actinophytocola sp. TaxID=1872138 RepID=UPI002DB5B943|nr:Cof-type HAD-IIB family hydrolase [Actinophytocola sp.]HEU5473265.1 Cof-type HAD-IIB family hydrolase [Actinophytocola sp.]